MFIILISYQYRWGFFCCTFKSCVRACFYEFTPCHVMRETSIGKNELASRGVCARSPVRMMHLGLSLTGKKISNVPVVAVFQKTDMLWRDMTSGNVITD